MQDPKSWQPNISVELLRARAEFIDNIRAFFKRRDCLEVDTPTLAHHGVTDVHLENLSCSTDSFGELYLQTSPEYAMKRLLAAHQCDIFQIARAYRDDESGRKHNPEFLLLEWYRLGIDHHQLMDEMDALFKELLETPAAERLTYEELFQNSLNIDVFADDLVPLKNLAKEQGLEGELSDKQAYLDFLFSFLIEPTLGKDRPIFVYDYPSEQAALARISDKNGRVAERFECFYRGMELANGFHELADAEEQTKRFARDIRTRAESGKPLRKADPYLLAALESGLPDCSGVALGLERLMMLKFNKSSIDEVMPFSIERI